MTDRLTTATPALRWGCTVLLSACVGFWSWFAIASGSSDGPESYAPAAIFVGSLATLLLSGVFAPRIGGVLAVLAAAFAAWFFDSTAARLMLALPLALAGLGLAIAGPWVWAFRKRRTALTPA